MIRSVLSALIILVTTPFWAIVFVLARVAGHRPWDAPFYDWIPRRWATGILFTAGAKVVVHGEEHLTAAGGVHICNHVSWFDVFAIAARLHRSTFVAKSELRGIPIFGWGADAAGVVFLDRDNRKAAFDSYKLAAAAVTAGRRIVVFPEGTRGFDYRLRQFKKGPFVMAISAAAPIVPTVIYGAREVMSKHSFRVRAGTIHVHYLEPIATAGRSYDDRTAIMRATMQRMSDCLEREYGVTTSGPA